MEAQRESEPPNSEASSTTLIPKGFKALRQAGEVLQE